MISRIITKGRAPYMFSETYTDQCRRCAQVFSAENPCWADDGYIETPGAGWDDHLHHDGICKNCAEGRNGAISPFA